MATIDVAAIKAAHQVAAGLWLTYKSELSAALTSHSGYAAVRARWLQVRDATASARALVQKTVDEASKDPSTDQSWFAWLGAYLTNDDATLSQLEKDQLALNVDQAAHPSSGGISNPSLGNLGQPAEPETPGWVLPAIGGALVLAAIWIFRR